MVASKIPQALLSLFYLCSSNIYALINYVGFATWVKCLYRVSNFKIAICKNSFFFVKSIKRLNDDYTNILSLDTLYFVHFISFGLVFHFCTQYSNCVSFRIFSLKSDFMSNQFYVDLSPLELHTK